MAPSSTTAKQSPGFVANAIKNKHSFIQFFAMTGIFLLSMRSVGQKYRINDLEEDTAALLKEQNSLSDRIHHIKQNLLAEAALDSTGTFAARLRLLFGDSIILFVVSSTTTFITMAGILKNITTPNWFMQPLQPPLLTV